MEAYPETDCKSKALEIALVLASFLGGALGVWWYVASPSLRLLVWFAACWFIYVPLLALTLFGAIPAIFGDDSNLTMMWVVSVMLCLLVSAFSGFVLMYVVGLLWFATCGFAAYLLGEMTYAMIRPTTATNSGCGHSDPKLY